MWLKRAVCASNSSPGAAVARACTVKRAATIADLASEFLTRMSGSAGTGNSVVVVPTPTDPAGIRRCARDLKTWSAGKKHTNVERDGSRDPGVRRPVKRGATIADLASEFLARMSDSAEAGNSVVVVPTPTDPAGMRRCARGLRTWSAEKKHTDEERGGRRDPGVRRPGAVCLADFNN